MKQLILLLALILGSGEAAAQQETDKTAEHTLVMISLDGFRWDYIEKHQAKQLAKLAKAGVRAERLTPVYPTKTFPNHISIITGLLPVNHGIVENRFCDKARDECYRLGKGKDDSTWLKGMPLWNLARLQGVKSATYFWPESDARFNGMTPDYYYHYSKHSDYQDRLDQMIQWLTLPESERPRFIAGYFSLVDSMGHDHGPDSTQVYNAVQKMDAMIGDFYLQLQALPQPVSLLIVSDHGMATINPKKSIQVSQLPISDEWKVQFSGPHLMLYAKKGVDADKAEQIAKLKAAAGGRFQYVSEETMKARKFFGSPRVPDIMFETRAPATFTLDKPATYFGDHGYPHFDDMDATLIGVGPAFKQGLMLERVSNLDIYPVAAEILGLELLVPVDGDGSSLSPALAE
ncbi:ectonucleotide pyrophosphatase/phosphodiesterase [Shewanella submarina]|uniref:Ectonucleotide pyrophosphatase/phosphodiesterase n=1 Tax=Shewanella submarina TaxID=2016376 RepID=A0ABV7GCZ3_9GAMM|nr:ectonucleotide pyrophosphatase/phosphodiesterase [Shewanella submarina]MCL1039929.1 ectonucleotide pyrophosphatase/phosphodiesterase [Shewanella submarina]